MLKKRFEIYYIIGSKIAGWIEKIFRRKELTNLRDLAFEQGIEIKNLTTGDSMCLDQHERRMILAAIELTPFRARIELPATKAHIRIIWRGLRKKLKMSIEKEDKPKEEESEISP